jgi:nucleoside phosphorylase
MTDLLLERLTAEPATVELAPIPWPAGLEPTPIKYRAESNASLPKADVLVVTWTSAEWQSLAAVLTPGVGKWDWLTYAEKWSEYESQLTWKSPAKEAKCMAEYYLTQIGDKRVLCVHSQLHLATDKVSAPVVQLWKQMIAEVEPKLVITTGTAGGIGAQCSLGDVFICNSAKFNCTKMFKDKPWAQRRFSNPVTISGPNLELARISLAQINAEKLPREYTPAGRTVTGHPVWVTISDNTGDVETVDYFGFDDTDDSYGIVKNDPQACSEEMDDATLPLALSAIAQVKAPPAWLSIRNASDPMVPSSIGSLEEQSKWASQIYSKWGYVTTIGSAIACWAVIADL